MDFMDLYDLPMERTTYDSDDDEDTVNDEDDKFNF